MDPLSSSSMLTTDFFLNCKTCLLISVKWKKFSSDNTYCIKKGMNALYVRHKKKIRKTTCLYYIRWISKVIQERFVCSIYFSSLFSTNFICNTDLLITWYSFRAEYQVSNPTNILLYRTAYVNLELHWRIWPVKMWFWEREPNYPRTAFKHIVAIPSKLGLNVPCRSNIQSIA